MRTTPNEQHTFVTFLNSLYQYCNGGFIHILLIDRVRITINKFISVEKLDSIPPFLKAYRGYNVYFGVATRLNGNMTKEGIIEIPCLWVDIDLTDKNGVDIPEDKKEILQRLKDFPLKPSFLINSGGGIHAYWKLKNPFSKKEIPLAENLLKRLASYFGGDKSSTDANHKLRIPGTLNLKPKYKTPRKVTIEEAHPENEYSPDDFEAILPQAEEPYHSEERQYHQETNERLNQIMECEFLKHCDCDRATLSEPEWYAMISILARETGGPNLIHSLSRGYPRYQPGETDKKILHAINDSGPATCERIKSLWTCGKDCGIKSPVSLAIKPQSAEGSEEPSSEPTPPPTETHWPSPINDKAFYGLTGEFVRLVESHTEADPVALLVQFLSATGNIIGANAHFRVEADKHYLKVNPVLVGDTSKGRKGTSLGYIKSLYQLVDPDWALGRLSFGGLSSGEGLVWEVRDEIWKKEYIREKGRVTKEFQQVLVDQGVSDKRLLVVEQEFSSTLRVMGRDGSTLSPTIRQSWDDSNLRILTKNSPARSTGCHISIIGHITRDELRRYLDRTEMANGFANRFLWVCVRRSKSLPEGSCFGEDGFESILGRLVGVMEFGQSIGEISKDDKAKKLWAGVYPDLSSGKPGLIGAVISRAEAQVMRLACLYAVLDKSNTITTDHLLAALALWDYCEASARYIWGDATGDPVADRILGAIRRADGGLSRTEISDLLLRHTSSRRIDLALSSMESLNLIKRTREVTAGRPTERWTAV